MRPTDPGFYRDVDGDLYAVNSDGDMWGVELFHSSTYDPPIERYAPFVREPDVPALKGCLPDTSGVDPASGVSVSIYVADDGVTTVQMDVPEGMRVRVRCNDGELADIREGGEEISLPDHWREYRTP